MFRLWNPRKASTAPASATTVDAQLVVVPSASVVGKRSVALSSTTDLCPYNPKYNQTVLDALAESKRCFKPPAITPENAALLMTAISVAAQTYDFSTSGVAPTETTATTAAAIVDSGISGGVSSKAFLDRLTDQQTVLDMFIEMAAPFAIACSYTVGDAQVAIEQPRGKAKEMLKALQNNGNLDVELVMPGARVTISSYPFKFSLRTLVTIGANFVPTLTLLGMEILRQMGMPLATVAHMAASAVAGSGPGKILDTFLAAFYKAETENLDNYQCLISNIYILPGRLHELPEGRIRPMERYLGESTDIIREAVSAALLEAKREPDPEAGDTTRLLTGGKTTQKFIAG